MMAYRFGNAGSKRTWKLLHGSMFQGARRVLSSRA